MENIENIQYVLQLITYQRLFSEFSSTYHKMRLSFLAKEYGKFSECLSTYHISTYYKMRFKFLSEIIKSANVAVVHNFADNIS